MVLHRLKDILDVITLASAHTFEGPTLIDAVQATFSRRGTPADVGVLDDILGMAGDRQWERAWAAMLKEKAALHRVTLSEALTRFDGFARPVLLALSDDVEPPCRWAPKTGWTRRR